MSVLFFPVIAAHFEQQLLRRPVFRRSFERGYGFLSGFNLSTIGLQGLSKIVVAPALSPGFSATRT